MMLYFIAIEIKGEPAEFYKNIGKEVHEKFGIEPLYLKLPFHITIKPPFEYEGELSAIEKTVRSAIYDHSLFILKLSTLGNFRKSVIFAEPEFSEELQVMTENILSTADSIYELEPKVKDISGKNKRSHASLVRFIPETEFSDIYSYIRERFPEGGWEIKVTEVSLLVQESGVWKIASRVPLEN